MKQRWIEMSDCVLTDGSQSLTTWTDSLSSTTRLRAGSTEKTSRTVEFTAVCTSYLHTGMGNLHIYIYKYASLCNMWTYRIAKIFNSVSTFSWLHNDNCTHLLDRLQYCKHKIIVILMILNGLPFLNVNTYITNKQQFCLKFYMTSQRS